ncbi:S8 family serine peptidase [Gracilibacillus marinus]|uniref:S8 family serine peptidase n=1 Tax=Gracilibacillus marinus TaxID=630535 RepID=A0ABV8VSJ4_9BACI
MQLFFILMLLSSVDQPLSYIIEVDGDPHSIAEEVEAHHPRVEVLAVYDTIFNGIAIKTTRRDLIKIEEEDFIKKTYPVTTYQTTQAEIPKNESVPFIIPDNLPYTGKGVKIGVIDTGIDYTHPDLMKNYRGGFDLVDFDKDPMETVPQQGIPTTHGTHVAGIIGADGEMKGVAPDAELYAYRALGPGGSGTSVQVMAAIERAVKDGMDILNLSLGNTINGPDWPTSVAVNKATEEGVTVVIAAGNTGPNPWTIGSPATADSVISVGASTPQIEIPYIYAPFADKKIELLPMQGTKKWEFTKDFNFIHEKEVRGQVPYNTILIVNRGEIPFTQLAKKAEELGAMGLLIVNNEEGIFQGAIDPTITIPVAAITKEDGAWLDKNAGTFLQIEKKEIEDTITDFSSRGPVTVNWSIKPDIVAPGASILSTVPGGYDAYNGTSMAAPHVAGAAALLKEAHPNWTPSQMKAALLTTADPFQAFQPNEQGAGKMDIEEAIGTDTLIYNNAIQLGRNKGMSNRMTHMLTIENVSERTISYSFQQPKQKKEIRFYLPASFTLAPGEKKDVAIEVVKNEHYTEEAFVQGYLQLNGYTLPYLWLTEHAEIPMAMGLDFYLEFFDDHYKYQLYIVEQNSKVTIDLYDSNTLEFIQTIVKKDGVNQGVLEGELAIKDVPTSGTYLANITIEAGEKEYQYQSIIQIEPAV